MSLIEIRRICTYTEEIMRENRDVLKKLAK